VAKASGSARRYTAESGDRARESAAPSPGRRARGDRKQATGAVLLDRLIHERIRLAMVSALAANQSMTFSELKALLGTTDGNLSIHARKLEDAGYVECAKSFVDRTPRTEYRLTPSGRRALERYLDHMEALIRAAREA
jgi:DNA-binding MarR family transcriptional regulator